MVGSPLKTFHQTEQSYSSKKKMEQDCTICQSSVSHAREQTWLLTLSRRREREENASEGIPFIQTFSSGKDRSICFPTETFFFCTNGKRSLSR